MGEASSISAELFLLLSLAVGALLFALQRAWSVLRRMRAIRGHNPVLAVRSRDPQLLHQVLDAGPRKDLLVEALFTAIQLEYLEMAEGLLQWGVDPNQTTKSGDSLLYRAAIDAESDMLALLRLYGADANFRDGQGKSAHERYQQWAKDTGEKMEADIEQLLT